MSADVEFPAKVGRQEAVGRMKSIPQIWQTRLAILAAGTICLATVAVADSLTGPEIAFSAFYLAPVVFIAWFTTRTIGMTFAAVSSALWLFVELNFGREYRHHLIPYGNGLLQLGVALFSSFLTTTVRDRERAVREESEGRKKAESELNLERALAEAVEAEQRRLGRDIHDGLGQHLVSTGFAASMLRTKLNEKGLPEVKEAEELSNLITDAIGQSRRLARGLFPVKLEAEGLASALQELADNVALRWRIVCRFECNTADTTVDIGTSSNLFRIAQEAVNNAVKHAEPKTITIHLSKTRTQLELTIVNDGKEYTSSGDSSGMGLRIMDYRARAIGGKMQLSTSSAGETKVAVRCQV